MLQRDRGRRSSSRVLTLAALLACGAGGALAKPPGQDPHDTPSQETDSHASQTPTPATTSKTTKPGATTANQGDKTTERAESKPSEKVKPTGKTSGTGLMTETPDADTALKMLTEGNARWVAGNPTAPNTDSARRQEVADSGQKPFVTVLTCADSRLPAERIFDRGVGDVFVVRVAGNVAGMSEVATIEYGTGHLGTPLLVVMGHTKCGAVAAAASGAQVHGAVERLVDRIEPAVERARAENPDASPEELTSIAIRENVWQTIFDLLRSSPETRSMVSSGKLTIVGAVCDIRTGKVDFMGPHPWQAELVQALEARESESSDATAQASEEPAGH
jgi:carbonic anhydrase/predicted small lipoprotein YifL